MCSSDLGDFAGLWSLSGVCGSGLMPVMSIGSVTPAVEANNKAFKLSLMKLGLSCCLTLRGVDSLAQVPGSS